MSLQAHRYHVELGSSLCHCRVFDCTNALQSWTGGAHDKTPGATGYLSRNPESGPRGSAFPALSVAWPLMTSWSYAALTRRRDASS